MRGHAPGRLWHQLPLRIHRTLANTVNPATRLPRCAQVGTREARVVHARRQGDSYTYNYFVCRLVTPVPRRGG
jgi:hypothetical protein